MTLPAVAEALLGLPGFKVLEVEESDAEVVVRIETKAALVGCPRCGVLATAQDRMAVEYRDLAVFGRPARLVWDKRRWRCEEPMCEVEDLDRVLAGVLGPLPAHEPGRRRVLRAGRAQRPPRHPDGERARGRLGHGHGGGARAWPAARR